MNKILMSTIFSLIFIIGMIFACAVTADGDMTNGNSSQKNCDVSHVKFNPRDVDFHDMAVGISDESLNSHALEGANHRQISINQHKCSYFSQKDTCYYIGAN